MQSKENLQSKNLFHTGEDLAANYLIRKGYNILERNYRIKGGEIDIIAQNDNTLIFVEVKTRKKHSMKLALMNISYNKQKRISLTAERYINQYPENVKKNIRFDIIIAFYYSENNTYRIEHLEDAFLPIL
ncbi:MAG: YraN family protein [Candidatus Cloacimonadaceae bacterium]|jgi:putative endonuclease|nr:YraN family protein [Candidatus Cloacimonadota bacterium]MCB5258534.1 YraN family protein [Candidatus Cloacimonadota bacterium]MDD5625297.1 YraN family protein [Candidatus Cloacimonadota bacterium]MDY0112242.1 YraN family protein [Candidatus Syntrophosphaera sp.]